MVNDVIETHPRRIKTIEEVDKILDQIDSYSSDIDTGVVLRQNMQLGGSLLVRTKKEYLNYLPENNRREFYCKFWPRTYFEKLRNKIYSEKR